MLGGRDADALLDHYQQERLPVAVGALAFGDTMVKLMTMRNPWQRTVRDTVMPLVSRLPYAQRRAAGRLSQTAAA